MQPIMHALLERQMRRDEFLIDHEQVERNRFAV
jgi:hypothetical protein